MSDPTIIFLAVAIFIIAVALWVSWAFRNKIRRERQLQRAHEQNEDGLSAGIGTGVGIEDEHFH